MLARMFREILTTRLYEEKKQVRQMRPSVTEL